MFRECLEEVDTWDCPKCPRWAECWEIIIAELGVLNANTADSRQKDDNE